MDFETTQKTPQNGGSKLDSDPFVSIIETGKSKWLSLQVSPIL